MAISLALIVVLGLAADILFRKFKLPGLVGMLIIGVLVGPYVLGLMRPEMMKVSADFRKIALIVILLRAGFELRRDTLNRIGKTAAVMSAVPAIFEIIVVTLIGPHFLHISYLEAAILGSILGAVSPAVVVPLMIDFIERGKGAKKGIPTLILAASSVDDVFVIVIFTILLGMYTGHKVNIAWQLAGIPISIILGIIVGIIPGYLLYKLFLKYDWQPPRRTLLVMGTAICLTWLEDVAHNVVPIASLLGVMAIGFIILEKEEAIAHIISQKLKKLWVFAELLLFVLVGAQVNISVAWKAGAAGLAVISLGLLARSVGTYLSVMGTDLDWKERLFCVVSYIPKATVQAAIGAVPLEAGVAAGEVILAVAVLSILVTAPLGAIGIMLMGEPILEIEKRTTYRFKDLREKLRLPRVGEKVRSKKYGTVWKIIEEREVWLEPAVPPETGFVPTPALYLRYWKVEPGLEPGRGKTMEYRYSILDSSFDQHWEILYD
ncbi:MAG: cation:proton antiporter [Deltaproteobacteria bacterium]|nr:cation:proton antiporter [Deltaproteobacteria bacterium]MBW2070892.1 cation:proton antiporter [Deltaproteobacteria bacterium]